MDIVRTNSDYSESLIKLNLRNAILGDEGHNIDLLSNDKVKIFSLSEMVPKDYVTIEGNVKSRGSYLLQENMTLYDLIFKSGGFFDEKFKSKTYLDRAELIRVNANGKKRIIPFNVGDVLVKKDLANELLKQEDLIKIYSREEVIGKTRFVSINGHVKYPGDYELFTKKI